MVPLFYPQVWNRKIQVTREKMARPFNIFAYRSFEESLFLYSGLKILVQNDLAQIRNKFDIKIFIITQIFTKIFKV